MKLPGFTANASLGSSKYSSRRGNVQSGLQNTIWPQLSAFRKLTRDNANDLNWEGGDRNPFDSHTLFNPGGCGYKEICQKFPRFGPEGSQVKCYTAWVCPSHFQRI